MTASAAVELLAVDKAVRSHDGQPFEILRNFSMTVSAGEFIAVTGPSGAGKSTLLNILGLLDVPSSGRYLLAGRDVATVSERNRTRLRAEHISFIFQAYHLLATKSVLDNVILGLSCQGTPRARRRAIAEQALGEVGLRTHQDAYPLTLSGGEQQRVAVARALARQSTLILADEPTGNLDAANADRVIQLLGGSLRDRAALVVVTHDPRIARAADRVIELGALAGTP
ncbi:MAG: macrolide ABC transporter ATP-binding protein [Pseudonocardiales bacterium]|nr:MAG: macrolide ABC transporter ATP-binding protein [Pseudonocardiales bacterium]